MKPTHVILILLIVLAVALSACVSQAPQENSQSTVPSSSTALTTVTVAYMPLISNAPLFIAKEEGYFDRQGINVEFQKVQSGAAALPILINGDVAVSGGALTPGFYNAITKGALVRIVADKGRMAPGFCNSSALMVRRDLYEKAIVRNVSDLKGRKIMASTEQTYGISRSLDLGNLSIDDVEIIDLDYPSGVIALKNGAVDAGVLTEPYITQALNGGMAIVLVPGNVYSPDYPLPLYYGPAFLDKDPELGRRFMVAYLQGVKQYGEGKTERNLDILQNYTHLDRGLLKQSCWLPIAEDGLVLRQPVLDYMDWMYANKKITEKLDEDQLFDMSFVNYANGVLRNSTDSKTPWYSLI